MGGKIWNLESGFTIGNILFAEQEFYIIYIRWFTYGGGDCLSYVIKIFIRLKYILYVLRLLLFGLDVACAENTVFKNEQQSSISINNRDCDYLQICGKISG